MNNSDKSHDLKFLFDKEESLLSVLTIVFIFEFHNRKSKEKVLLAYWLASPKWIHTNGEIIWIKPFFDKFLTDFLRRTCKNILNYNPDWKTEIATSANVALRWLTTAKSIAVIHIELPFLIWSSFNTFSRNSCRENTMNRKKWGKVGHLKDPLTKTVFILKIECSLLVNLNISS